MGRVYPRYSDAILQVGTSADPNSRRNSIDKNPPQKIDDPSTTAPNSTSSSTINLYQPHPQPFTQQSTFQIPVEPQLQKPHTSTQQPRQTSGISITTLISPGSTSRRGSTFDHSQSSPDLSSLEDGFGPTEAQKPTLFGRIKQVSSYLGSLTAQAADALVGIETPNPPPQEDFPNSDPSPFIPAALKVKLPEPPKPKSYIYTPHPQQPPMQMGQTGKSQSFYYEPKNSKYEFYNSRSVSTQEMKSDDEVGKVKGMFGFRRGSGVENPKGSDNC